MVKFLFGGFRVLELVLFSVFIFISLKIPAEGEYHSYTIDPADKLEGSYELNTLLNGAEHLYSGLLKGPNSIVAIDNKLYTGVHGGHIIKLASNKIKNINKFGQQCDGDWQEAKCGRPFGLTVDKSGNLFVADAYYGIWKVNVTNGKKENIVPRDVPIDGKIPKIYNSLKVSRNGDIYWTDSSTVVEIQNGFYSMFMDGNGRLIKYDSASNQCEVLVDKILFANGLVLSPDEDFVVVAEMASSRLIRYYISGAKQGSTDIFLDHLPGFPGNLKTYGDYIIVPLVHSRDRSEPVLFQYISTYPLLRKAIVQTMATIEKIFDILNKIYPCHLLEKIIHAIGHFETVSVFAPKRVTVLIVDLDGNVIESWHNLDGSLSAISDVLVFDGHLYFGSPYNTYIGRVPIPKTKSNFGRASLPIKTQEL